MEANIIQNDLDSLYNCRRPRRGVRIKEHRLVMENTYNITLFNSCTEEYTLRQEKFITFEEAVVHANHTRHKLGMDWKTVSIVEVQKGKNNAFATKKN